MPGSMSGGRRARSDTAGDPPHSGGLRSGARGAGDDADLTARLDDRPLDLVERRDLLQPRGLGELLDGQPLGAHVVLDRLAVLDDDERRGLEDPAHRLEAEAEPRGSDREEGERADREDEPRERHVALGHPLLDEVADHDDEDQVERLEGGQLTATGDAEQDVDEDEGGGGPKDDVHRNPPRGRRSPYGRSRRASGLRRATRRSGRAGRRSSGLPAGTGT